MSAHCCAGGQGAPQPGSGQDDAGYRRVLWAVLGINAVMFLVEIVAGLAAGSVSLQADALDFLADAGNYGISLFVLVFIFVLKLVFYNVAFIIFWLKFLRCFIVGFTLLIVFGVIGAMLSDTSVPILKFSVDAGRGRGRAHAGPGGRGGDRRGQPADVQPLPAGPATRPDAALSRHHAGTRDAGAGHPRGLRQRQHPRSVLRLRRHGPAGSAARGDADRAP